MSYSEDSDNEYQEFFAGKEGIVFLIDATEPMFDCQQFSLAIQCVENVMKNKAIASPDDQLAVILFGTDKTSNEEDFEHLFVFQNMQKSSAESVLKLKGLKDSDFDTKFGHNNQYSLAEVFSLAIQEFNQSRVKYVSKRVILLTSTSDPYSEGSVEDKHLRKITFIRAKTFDNYSIGFELIPLVSKDNKAFDINAFYGEAFPHFKDDKCDTLAKLEPLLHRIYSRSHKNRQVASIPFRLGSTPQPNEDITELEISINVYKLYSITSKPTPVVISGNDLEKAKSKTLFLSQDSEKGLTQNILKSYDFGKESISMTQMEAKKVTEFEEPALNLLGFKPRTALLSHIHLKPGHFIFPDELTIKGSTVLFNALLKRCVERDKIPICRLTLRKSGTPCLVALYPQIESKALGKAGGFHVVYLPFKDDLRELDIKNAKQLPVKEDALDLAKKIVNNLTFNYDPKNFPNPIIQNHWRVIEGLALNQTIEPYDDSQTQPDYSNIESKVGYDLYSLNTMLGGYDVQPVQKVVKPVKVYEDLSDLVNKNQLGILTVPELKEFCKQKTINCGTKKAEIMEAIRSYYKRNLFSTKK